MGAGRAKISAIAPSGSEASRTCWDGGSSLGPKALWDAYGQWQSHLEEMIFFDNLDSEVFFSTLERLHDPTDIHFILISKSGTTLETLAMADFIDQFLRERGSQLSDQCTAITELRSSPLFNWAQTHRVPTLEIPLDVGGRFSVLSPVGLLPAAMMGCSLNDLQEGLQWVKSSSELTESLVAAAIQSLKRQDQVLYFWPYSQGLEVFGGWFQQLWAESLGKSFCRSGSGAGAVANRAEPVAVPVPSLGPRDQHSILQQVMDSVTSRWVWILKNGQSGQKGPHLKQSLFEQGEWRNGRTMDDLVLAQAEAIQSALAHNEIPFLTLSLSGVSPKTIGALFFLMELVVGGVGEVMDINAFDQPGVELAKRKTKELLLEKSPPI